MCKIVYCQSAPLKLLLIQLNNLLWAYTRQSNNQNQNELSPNLDNSQVMKSLEHKGQFSEVFATAIRSKMCFP